MSPPSLSRGLPKSFEICQAVPLWRGQGDQRLLYVGLLGHIQASVLEHGQGGSSISVRPLSTTACSTDNSEVPICCSIYGMPRFPEALSSLDAKGQKGHADLLRLGAGMGADLINGPGLGAGENWSSWAV